MSPVLVVIADEGYRELVGQLLETREIDTLLCTT
jgi:hypothetical protein